MIKKLSYAAPFLVAIFTVVTLYQANAERLGPGSMLAPAIFGLGIAGLFLLLFWLFKWTTTAAPFVASGFSAVFLLWYVLPWPVDLALLAVILLVGIGAKRYAIYGTVAIIVITLVGSSFSGVQAARIASHSEDAVNSGPYIVNPGQANIYFIVPDHMPSPAAMRESGIDPDQFIKDLRSLGFYVNEDQVSEDRYYVDYPDKIYTTRTMRFFASVLNGGATIPTNIPYQECRTMIKDNAVFTWLHGKGYEIYNYASWFTETARFTDAEANYMFKDVTLFERFIQNELGEAYFDRTILRGLPIRAAQSDESNKSIEVRRHDWQADKILEMAAGDYTSTFVISHIMLPHEPYVYADPHWSVPDQYQANILYAMDYLTALAGGIRSLDPTAIIIIQSDEGMAYRKPPELNYDLSPVQWSGVLSAWYLPGYKNLDVIKHTEILDIVINNK